MCVVIVCSEALNAGTCRHLGHRTQFGPTKRGFDRALWLPFSAGSGSTDHLSATKGGGGVCDFDVDKTHWLPLYNGTEIVEAPVNLSSLADKYASAAQSFIAEQAAAQRPFFLYFPFSHIHHLCAPGSPAGEQQWAGPKFFREGTSGGVADAVEEMDWITGQVLQALSEAEVVSSTLVLWIADNGPTTSELRNGGTAGPFIGRYAQRVVPDNCTTCPHGYTSDVTGKTRVCSSPSHQLQGVPCAQDVGLGSTWEANLRMPAFARWPGKILAGSVSFELVSTLDIFATGLALAALPLPTDRTIDGRDIRPVLFGTGPSPHDFLFHYRDDCPGHCGAHATPQPFVCNCSGPLGAPKQRLYAARHGVWKAHFITKSAFGLDTPVVHSPPLLFNIAADPAEEYPVSRDAAPPGMLASIVQAAADFDATLVWGRKKQGVICFPWPCPLLTISIACDHILMVSYVRCDECARRFHFLAMLHRVSSPRRPSYK